MRRGALLVVLLLFVAGLPTGCSMPESQCHDEGFEDGVELGLSTDYGTRIKPPRRCTREGDQAYYEGVLEGCRSTGDTCWTTVVVEDGQAKVYNQIIPDEPAPSPTARTTQDSTNR